MRYKNVNRIKECRGAAYVNWYFLGGKFRHRKIYGQPCPYTEYKWETDALTNYRILIGTSCGYPDYVEQDMLIENSKRYAMAVRLRAE